MDKQKLFRVSAFAEVAGGGNPAGVWVGESLPSAERMQVIAAEVGYSETAFVAPLSGADRTVRYFSPLAEVPFCGHATIATGFVLGSEGDSTTYRLATKAGEIAVNVRRHDESLRISLTSVATRHRVASAQLTGQFLSLLGWREDELDSSIPPAFAFAGAWHLVLAVRDKARLDDMHYEFDAMHQRMLEHDLTTLQLIWRSADNKFHARNPFPVGGVVEDPATGAAAAALGGYLRDAKLIAAPFKLTIRQGDIMGRPSVIEVLAPVTGGIDVVGSAMEIAAE